ncbi:MAG: CRTAC1 family protein [Acidobacteriaceae bacterium]
MNRRTFSVLSAGLFLEALVGCSKKSSRPKQQIFNSEARALPTDHPTVIFTDVTRQSGIDFVHSAGVRTHQLPEDMGSGAAWGDYDNDGYPDLYLVNQPGPWGQPASRDSPTSRLYHNNGDGTFTDVTERAGVANRGGFGMGAAWGDYDNDGLLDLYVTNYGRSVLYHNNGDGTFTDVTDRAGVANHRWGMTPVWFDYDNDGYLDLYVPNYVDYNLKGVPAGATSQEYGIDVPFTLNPASFAPVPNRLYHNNRDGTFTDVAPRLRVADASGRSLSVAFADFTLNGWQDIYVGNDISSNRLYRNLGHGRFQDVSASSWSEEYRGTMGIAIGDFDRDGDLDMFLSHWIGQGDALYQNLWNEQKSAGKLHFENVADMYGCGAISYSTAGWGTFFFDFDNDGWLDLLVLNGSTFEDKSDTTKLVPEKPFLLWSKGEGGFFDLAASGVAGSALQIPRNARGAAYADYDRDGDLDMIVTTNHGRAVLLRNDGGNRNHWLSIHLIGKRSNRQGIGARLILEAGGKRYLRQYGVQGSYLSSSVPEAWFGLGQNKQIDSLAIAWPSGSRQVFRNLPIDRTLTITEGRSVWEGKTATPSRV